jgi:hypothetical protein
MNFILGKRKPEVNPVLKKFGVHLTAAGRELGVRIRNQYKIKTPNTELSYSKLLY